MGFELNKYSLIQTIISRCIKDYLSEKRKFEGKVFIRISLPFTGIIKNYGIMGSFTREPWREELKFVFSLSKKEYFITLWLSPGDTFLLKLKGREFMHPDFPIMTVKSS